MSSRDSGPMGGAIAWRLAERIAPECSPRWDADGMAEWQGEREGPYLHLTWERPESLIAVVYDPLERLYTAARWDGPMIGWTKDAHSGSAYDVFQTPSFIQCEGTVLRTGALAELWNMETGGPASTDGQV